MTTLEYENVIGQYPTVIDLPRIDRPYRSSDKTFADVTGRCDLPSRLFFGDMVDDSFHIDPTGWSVSYSDGAGNGLELKVSDGRFLAKPTFLGTESMSVGPAAQKKAFLQLISFTGDMWASTLKAHLEARYPVCVAETPRDQSSACYYPDGWLRTLLIPLPVSRLDAAFRFHLNLANDPLLAASVSGSITLLHQVVNYVEGRAPVGCDESYGLLLRHLDHCNTPLTSPTVREEANDGTAAWTVRRMTYLYQCRCFLRDVPRVMEKLQAAKLLSDEPDLWSAVVPAEQMAMTDHAAWWSAKRECRSTRVGFKASDLLEIEEETYDEAVSLAVIKKAQVAGAANSAFFAELMSEAENA